MQYYCGPEEIERYVSTATLIQLTADDGSYEINLRVVEEATDYAAALINGYIQSRYDLPYETWYPLLHSIAIDLSVYRLYSRRVINEIPEAVKIAYQNAVSILKDMQKGIISLNGENEYYEKTFKSDEYKLNKNDRDRLFNKEKMSEF